MKQTLTKLALVFGAIPVVWAVCEPDFTGLSGINAFRQTSSTSYSGLPDGHVDATGARTTEDFVNAVANQLFFTSEGSRFLGEVFHWTLGFPGIAARAYADPPPVSISGYACNEIGQCRDTRTVVTFSGRTDSLFDAVVGFFTGGVISGVNVKFIPEAYTITATNFDGTDTDPRDFINYSIRQQAADKDLYDLSTDGDENIDTDCRDNAGNVVNGQSEGTGGDAGGGDIELDWDYYYDLEAPAEDWDCWASSTGVVCKKAEK
jgi:hypothetical protein